MLSTKKATAIIINHLVGGKMQSLWLSFPCYLLVLVVAKSSIDRQKVVQAFNVHRNASSSTTPLQVGNGNFAFGVDVTGLQTFNPFASMSTWGWHNFSLPTTPNQTYVDGETGGHVLCLGFNGLTSMKTSPAWTGGLRLSISQVTGAL